MVSPKVPSRLLKPRELAEVPRAEYGELVPETDLVNTGKRLAFLNRLRKAPKAEPRVTQATRKRKVHLNAAAWMRTSCAPDQPVSLVLHYEDSSGDFCVMVDEVKTNEHGAVMMSGHVTLELKGDVTFVRAAVSGLGNEDTILVDELYVQREEPAAESGARKTA